jgi:hypothetical protein
VNSCQALLIVRPPTPDGPADGVSTAIRRGLAGAHSVLVRGGCSPVGRAATVADSPGRHQRPQRRRASEHRPGGRPGPSAEAGRRPAGRPRPPHSGRTPGDAVILLPPDLSITPTVCRAELPPGSHRGHLDTTDGHLQHLFGSAQPLRGPAWTADVSGWIVHTPTGPIALHGQHQTARRDLVRPSIRWHLWCADDQPLPWLTKAVQGTTAGFPTTVLDLIDSNSTPAGLLLAYVDYLYLRGRALQRTGRDALSAAPATTLGDQLIAVSLTVLELRYRLQLADLAATDRHAWATATPPARGWFDTDLQHHHARVHALYGPVVTAYHPTSDPPAAVAHHLRGLATSLITSAPVGGTSEAAGTADDDQRSVTRGAGTSAVGGSPAALLPESMPEVSATLRGLATVLGRLCRR